MGYLTVIVTPDIVDIRGPSTIIEGGNARLECEARGEPAPLVFWQRENSKEKITVLNKRLGMETSASIGALDVYLPSSYNQPTSQLTDQQTDMRVHRQVTHPTLYAEISNHLRCYQQTNSKDCM